MRGIRWFGLVCSSVALAIACPQVRAQGTFTAATCNQSDVNAVINGPTHTAVNGDTINIPAGNCNWNSGVNISGVGISIIGAGTPNTSAATIGAGSSTTVITGGGATPLFNVSGLTYGQTMRISLMQLQPGAGVTAAVAPIQIVGGCTTSGCANARVDNITFPSSWQNAGLPAISITVAVNVFGVWDHDTLTGSGSLGLYLVNGNHSSWQGVGQYGDNSWASPDTFGTAQAIFVENNKFDHANATDTDRGDSNTDTGGGRFVCRYNTFNPINTSGPACGTHGTATTGRPRGGRQMEVYGNSFTCSGSCNATIGINSGVYLIFNNTLASGSLNAYAVLSPQRAYYGPFVPWGSCDGTGSYDQNDGIVYASGTITAGGTITFSDSSKSWTTNQWVDPNGAPYSIHDVTQGFGSEITSNTATQYTVFAPLAKGGAGWTWNVGDSYQILRATFCIDQPARGQGTLLSGTTPSPTGSVSGVLDPIYEWGDIAIGSVGQAIKTSGTGKLIGDRDWYSETVNQSAQISPISPFIGISGTGHGTLANRPPTCTTGVAYWATDQGTWNNSGSGGQGVLYKCTAANTWTQTYEPYAYPHPLVTGTPGSGRNPPSPPTNLVVTVQ